MDRVRDKLSEVRKYAFKRESLILSELNTCMGRIGSGFVADDGCCSLSVQVIPRWKVQIILSIGGYTGSTVIQKVPRKPVK